MAIQNVVGHKYTYKTMAVLAVVYGLAVCVCAHIATALIASFLSTNHPATV